MKMDKISLAGLLENGAHLGHHISKYNPDMSQYIIGSRSGFNIIDLEITLQSLRRALSFVNQVASNGGQVLFICTNSHYSNVIAKTAKKCNQPYINRQWIGGLLTNYTHMRRKILKTEGCSQKFMISTQGIRNMDTLPSAIFIIGTNNCATALHEASILRIPSIAIVDTNCSLSNITYTIPGNDDSILAVNLFCNLISNAILDGTNTLSMS